MQMNSSSIQEKVDFLAFLGFTFPIPLAYQLAEILIHKHSYEMTCFDAIHIWKVSAYIINFFFFHSIETFIKESIPVSISGTQIIWRQGIEILRTHHQKSISGGPHTI